MHAFSTASRARSATAALLPAGRFGCLLIASCLFLATTGCDRDGTITSTTPNGSRLELPREAEPVEFDATVVEVHSDGQIHTLNTEIAATAAQRERGLMYRTSMPEESAMLFVYPSEQEGGFWMYNTHIPLSIAYADSLGVIFQMEQMQPCTSPYATLCRTYPARQAFQYALEVNQNYFTSRSIRPGDRIVPQTPVAAK
jgi:uncharacterized protein